MHFTTTSIQWNGKTSSNLAQMKPISHSIIILNSVKIVTTIPMTITRTKPTSDPLARCVLSVEIMVNHAFVE